MQLNDFFDDCQAGTCSLIFFPAMEALEYDKNFFMEFLVYPDAIVFYREKIRIIFRISKSNFHYRIWFVIELDGIADKVPKDNCKLDFIAVYIREFLGNDKLDPFLTDCKLHIRFDIINNAFQRNNLECLRRAADAGKH